MIWLFDYRFFSSLVRLHRRTGFYTFEKINVFWIFFQWAHFCRRFESNSFHSSNRILFTARVKDIKSKSSLLYHGIFLLHFRTIFATFRFFRRRRWEFSCIEIKEFSSIPKMSFLVFAQCFIFGVKIIHLGTSKQF